MTEISAAVAGIIGTIIVSVFTYFMARRAGIGPYQDTLVSKLKTLVDIQENEIKSLNDKNATLAIRVADLEKKVEELEQLTVRQAIVIDKLKPARQRKREEEQRVSSQEGDI
jgi:16S rRNA C967 or C1407 C5-methylase (RsmB/RsmF family)